MDTTPVPAPAKIHHTPNFYTHEFIHDLHMRIVALEEHVHPKQPISTLSDPESDQPVTVNTNGTVKPAAPSDHEPTA